MAKQYRNIQTDPTGPTHAPSDIEGLRHPERKSESERLQDAMSNPVGWGKLRSCKARNAQDTTAHDVKGTNNGSND